MLFNIVVDMLVVIIERAKNDGQVGGLIPHLVEGGICILQYVRGYDYFLEHDLLKAVNMKLIICLFEELSGFQINFRKSDFFVLVRKRMRLISASRYLDATLVPYPLDTLVFLSITENSEILNGTQ
jgi:hypothetical protein